MTSLYFYEKPVALDRHQHRNLRLKVSQRTFHFAAKTIAIPLAPIEFPQAVFEYPIVFALQENGPGTPLALTGLRENESLVVDESGRWTGEYISAFVRRYPFVLNVDVDTETPLVVIDEDFDGFSATEGERLFDEDGGETPLLKGTLAFIADFKTQSEFSNGFMQRLKKYDLLIPQSISVKRDDDASSFSLDGFHIVDEKRLLALSDAAMLELARNGDLGRIHTHLLSLNNVHRLVRRLSIKNQAISSHATA